MRSPRPPRPPAPLNDARTQPHNLEAEKAVLGTFFLNEAALADVQTLLEPEDFHDPRHQEIYRVVLDLAADSKPIDPLTIVNELERKGVLEKVGGAAYVTGLEQYVISPGNVLHHAKIVHEKSLLRRLIRTSAEIAEDAYTESDDAKSLLQASEQKIFNILSGRSSAGEFRSIDEEASQVFLDVVHRAEKRDEVSGLPTGLSDLDKMTGGMHPSDLMILAARPSVGKTSLALNMAVSACRHKREFGDEFKHPAAAVFSLEMSRDQLIQRLVCTEAEIPMDLLRKNMMSEKQLRKFQDGLTALRELPIYINDTAGLDPTELRLQAQRLKSRVPELSLIVIDYLQLMSIRHSNVENRQQEVSQISRMLKALARDLNVPVLALSQLSRGVESRTAKDAKPRLSDLRESGAIEQDADVVMFLHRVFRPEREAGEERGNQPSVSQVDLIIAKQRNGPIGTCHLLFLEDYTHFVRMAPEDVPPGGH